MSSKHRAKQKSEKIILLYYKYMKKLVVVDIYYTEVFNIVVTIRIDRW